MKAVDEFRSRVAESGLLTTMIDNIEERPYGIVYRFDGHVECAVISTESGYIDAQDVNIETLDSTGASSDILQPNTKLIVYGNLKTLVERMEHELL